MKCKMEPREYRDLIDTVAEPMNWDCIVEAYTRGLAGVITREQKESIDALRAVGVLDDMSKLDPKWRKAIDDAGRPIYEVPDKKSIVDRWHRSEFSAYGGL